MSSVDKTYSVNLQHASLGFGSGEYEPVLFFGVRRDWALEPLRAMTVIGVSAGVMAVESGGSAFAGMLVCSLL